MNKFIPLLKVQIKELFDFNSSKQKKRSSTTYLTMLIIASIGLFVLFSVYASTFYGLCLLADNLKAFEGILTLFITMVSLFTLFTSIYQIKSFIYDSNDYDFLASLPLKRSVIVASKITIIYLFDLGFASLCLITPFILYVSINPIFLAFILPLIILIPLFPTLIASLLALLVSFIEKKIPFGNIIKVILSLLSMVLIFAFSFFMSYFSSAQDEEITSMIDLLINSSNTFSLVYPLLYLIRFGFFNLNPLYIILYVALNIGFLFLTLLVITKTYYSLRAKNKASIARKNKKEIEVKTTSQLKTYMGMDLKRITSSTTVLTNTLVGSLMSIFLVVIIGINLITIGPGDSLNEILPYFPLLTCFACGVLPITTYIISLEGKNFWIIKTSPLNVKKYLISKLIVNHIFYGTGALISSITALILIRSNDIPLIILTLLLPQLYILFISALGLIIGIYFVRLEWTNERMLMKNSGSTLLVFVTSFVLDILLALATFLSYIYVSSILSLILSLIIVLLAIAIVYSILFTCGINRFKKIEC